MSLFRDEAIVLRTHQLGEADRIVTLFTRRHGRVRAVAKGVRRTSSRFGARLEPFTLIDTQLWHGRNLDTVTQVESLGAYGRQIGAHYPTYTAATVMAETAERLTEVEREPATQLFILLAGALRSLSRGEHEPDLTLNSYLVRALAVSGWAASFEDCARCGATGPHRGFAVAAGGAVCRDCRPPGAAAPHPEAMPLLAALLSGDWARAETFDDAARRSAGGLVNAYVQWHIERGVRSLRHVVREEAAPDVERVLR